MCRRGIGLGCFDHDEVLAVRGDVVTVDAPLKFRGIAGFKEDSGSSDRRAALSNIDDHDAVTVPVEQLATAGRPCRARASVGRDSELRTGLRKRAKVYLVLARLVGHVRDPMAVRRNHREPLIIRLRHEGLRIRVTPHGLNPNIKTTRGERNGVPSGDQDPGS